MIKHFCDLCDKELTSDNTEITSTLQWYKLSRVSYNCYNQEYEAASTEICNDCLKAIVMKRYEGGA